ncbi:N-6 DNA methylase [Oscillochloris sp. ZM17-4]|uniref:N-6 DNA methylase n=1 Tax=Oscillochloris sp. ZM17-4 TaxID=2866714 RepID=UPI001C7345C7|nr:N-6 DNA methylase [Oscillochloris sp. ZM17-4]MBX0326442.1 N-6 DNA methylase [Oscillochloris sp. ZM17-4]
MTTPPTASAAFLAGLQHILTRAGFRGGDLRAYLARPAAQRGGDEASIVDRAIVGPLLDLLGFPPGDQNYNLQRHGDRPDFAPSVDLYGTCFVVESKNTTLSLPGDMADPESPLAQLQRYMRLTTVNLGVLTNARRLLLYAREGAALSLLLDLDVEALLDLWAQDPSAALPPPVAGQLAMIERLCHASAFSAPARIEQELAVDLPTWQARALPLGTDARHEDLLVEDVQRLIATLHADARQRLQQHLDRDAEYRRRRRFVDGREAEEAGPRLEALRAGVIAAVGQVRATIGLSDEQLGEIRAILDGLPLESNPFRSKKAVFDAVLTIINAARAAKFADKPSQARPWADLDALTSVRDTLATYVEKVGVYLKHLADLRQAYRDTRAVMEDFETWRALVQETMLGGKDEAEQAGEFALQAAYVVFIRLLLIRVCEDKGLFAHRFVSDGGISHWQEDIRRYLTFANGNPYAPLLDMAYANAQNIYAHFFTGREVFNWYKLDKDQLLMALHRLSRFDFAGVNADIVGTIYNTYVDRKAKKEKGQYYTPREIVDYMLDAVGYVSGPAIIGPNRRLIDPACGSGSFLVAAARRLVAAYTASAPDDDPTPLLEQVRQSLFGFDLNPFACYLSEVNLLIQVLDLVKLAFDRGRRVTLERFHIYNEDALASPTAMFSYSRAQLELAEESAEADRIKRRAPGTPYAAGFAFVVANPPYGASVSDDYKAVLRGDWPQVFYGQPDTYVFFFALAIKLLAARGRMAFITPNTYLMGTNTALLRRALLDAGRIEQIVDLPQGIWPDANVDCAILVLAEEADAELRQAQQTHALMMGLRDGLDKLTDRAWREQISHPQQRWMGDPRAEINIRYDDLIQQIEDACRLPSNGSTRVLRLGEVTESSPAIEPYQTAEQGRQNLYIKQRSELPEGELGWKKLLDGNSHIGRYSLRWGVKKHYLHYGHWLWRARDQRFFEMPKLLVQDMRNRALKRRLVAAYDEQQFFNRKNFSNIIAKDGSGYDLKYLLALFNSSLLNYWFARQYDNLHINPSYFRQLPIFPADAATQAGLAGLVDELLGVHAALNELRERGYAIRRRAGKDDRIDIPYDLVLEQLQAAQPGFAPYTLYQALASGAVSLPDEADTAATVGSNVYTPERHPTSVVLRHNKLWLIVADDDLRDYLVHYLGRPQWRGQAWKDVQATALLPVDPADRASFAARIAERHKAITDRLDRIDQLDAEIDRRVLDLYGISDPAARARILGSAPEDADDAVSEDEADDV